MGIIPTPEQWEKHLNESADYRCRYCGHVAKSHAWKHVEVCVNWTTKHRDPNAFDLCPSCNVIGSVEVKRFDEPDSAYVIKENHYDLVKHKYKESRSIYDYAETVEEAIQWHKRRRKGHPDDLFPDNGVLIYKNEIIKYEDDAI